jgi:pyruvate/2-oxoglutarate dehydrogenase complex dihydrolipoamide dehydrogenase (E3) component
VRFVIIGGGPGGNTAATVAASLGAEVTLIERDVVGGAAHLWDCIPSKAMVATGNGWPSSRAPTRWGSKRRAARRPALRERIGGMEATLRDRGHEPARVAGRPPDARHGPAPGAYTVAADTDDGTRRPRGRRDPARDGIAPARARLGAVDGERILTTRQAYPPPEIPEHLVVIGSGVTGVEFTHMFSALGSQVTLIVSRQQVLPTRTPRSRRCSRTSSSAAA